MSESREPQIRFASYNPYESRYPGRRVVSREVTLVLMKEFRTEGYEVAVEPAGGTKLEYLKKAGLRELLSDRPILFMSRFLGCLSVAR